MTYKELKQIAQPHIREGENLPSNSFLLLNQLHVPFKNEKQCEQDFNEGTNPIKNNPAFLSIDLKGNKTVYFNSNTPYWNFYIFHEIAHYLLGHEQNSPQNEIDADLLACILAAPVENLPTTLKTARDLSSLCKIPIDKAEVYWKEIKNSFIKPKNKFLIYGCLLLIIIVIVSVINILLYFNDKNVQNTVVDQQSNTLSTPETNKTGISDSGYYITSSGTHYHSHDCQHIKYKTNIISISLDEAKKLNLEPCQECIE